MAIYLKNDEYVCTMYDDNYSHCYCTAYYDRSRSGNTMNYTLTVGFRMGDNTAYCKYRWLVQVRIWNGSAWDTLDNKEIKGFTGGTIGKTYYWGTWTWSKNTNTDSSEVQIIWKNYNYYYADMGPNWGWAVAGYMAALTPEGPSAPSSASIPSAIAPDKTASLSWGSASGGTNGVSGYAWSWSRNGGSSWSGDSATTSRSASLNLNSNGFVQNSVLRLRVRAYSTVNGVNYYSGYTYSGNTTTVFVAPSVPRSLSLGYNEEEPIPTATFNASWVSPSSGGTNGVSGYTIVWRKNGSNYTSDVDIGNVTRRSYTLTENYAVGDTISFAVRAYTIGQGNKYYSSYSYSGTITIVSDKFIFVSINNGAFIKYKMYVSQNGGTFKEVKKNKFNII